MPAAAMSQGQQQQQTQPPVVVVQQPIVVDGRKRASPFVLRGARFSNGCTFPGQLFVLMTTFGIVFASTGIISLYFNGLDITEGLMTVIGLTLFIPGLLLCITAKRQFDELPPDHPHRLKYGTGYRIPVNRFNNTTTYALPAASVASPGGAIAGYPVMTTVGQASSYPVQVAGQTATNPYLAAGQSDGEMGRYPTEGRRSPVPPPGHDSNVHPTSPQYSFYDPPPAYSEISKDTNFKPPV